METREKITATIAVVALWGLLAVMGYTPVEPYIQVLRDILIAMGVYGATLTNPSGIK